MEAIENKTTWYGRNGYIIWSALLFGVYLSVFFAFLTSRFGQVQFIEPFTHVLGLCTSFFLNIFGIATRVDGVHVIGETFSVQISNGCNGVYVTALVSAAILATPASWMHRVLGVALAASAIYVINLIRSTSLFIIGDLKYEWFDFAHVYFWQTVVVLATLAIFLAWTGWSFPKNREAAG